MMIMIMLKSGRKAIVHKLFKVFSLSITISFLLDKWLYDMGFFAKYKLFHFFLSKAVNQRINKRI